jgi:hypothetical protein
MYSMKMEHTMLRVWGKYQQRVTGEWKQSSEILHEGFVLGFIEHEKTADAELIRTRNLCGEVREGECIDWLLQKAS